MSVLDSYRTKVTFRVGDRGLVEDAGEKTDLTYRVICVDCLSRWNPIVALVDYGCGYETVDQFAENGAGANNGLRLLPPERP